MSMISYWFGGYRIPRCGMGFGGDVGGSISTSLFEAAALRRRGRLTLSQALDMGLVLLRD